MKKTSAFICLAVLGAVSMNAAPLLYDLGTPGSPVRKNFSPLDIKSKVWSSKTKLFVKTNKIVRESGVNRNSGRADPPVYFNELTCDHIGSKGGADLTFAVPDGRYKVWILTGRAGGDSSQVWDIKVVSGSARAAMTYAGAAEIHALELDAVARKGQK